MANEIAQKLPYRGGFPVYLSRFVIFGGEERRVALRFFNASDVAVTGLRFVLVQKDGEGNVLSERAAERSGFYAESMTEFSVADAALDEKCVSVEARLEAAVSEGYEYVVEEGGVKLKYGTKKTEKESEASFVQKPSCTVSKKYGKIVAFAVFAVVAAVAVAGLLAWRLGFFGTWTASASELSAVIRSINE